MSDPDNVFELRILSKEADDTVEPAEDKPEPLASPEVIAAMLAQIDELRSKVEAGEVGGLVLMVLDQDGFDPSVILAEDDVPYLVYGLESLKMTLLLGDA